MGQYNRRDVTLNKIDLESMPADEQTELSISLLTHNSVIMKSIFAKRLLSPAFRPYGVAMSDKYF